MTTMTDLATGRSFVFNEALPGRDAYEEALALGFVGSRADWVASLKGFEFDPDNPAWAAGTSYPKRAAVTHAHSFWVAVRASLGVEPGTDAAFWVRLMQGDDPAALAAAVAEAGARRDKAAQWAQAAPGVAVEPGQFSARHHAAQSETARQQAEALRNETQAAAALAATAPTADRVPRAPVGRAHLAPGWIDPELTISALGLQRSLAALPAGLPEPTLVLDFARGGYGARDAASGLLRPMAFADQVAFTRAGEARRFDWDGLLKAAPLNAPRFDFDPMTRQRRLLLESAATNILARSQALDNPVYGRNSAVPVPVVVAEAAPDGSGTVFRLVEGTTNDRHWVGRTAQPIVAGSWNTVSIFAKAGTRSHIGVVTGESGGSFRRAGSIVNLLDGSVSNVNFGSPAGVVRHPPQALPGGWWRIAVSVRIDDFAAFGMVEFWPSSAAGVTNYAGDGVSGVLAWGVQYEAGMVPTAYIPTEATAVTRAADNATLPTAGWVTQGQGTVLAVGRRLRGAQARIVDLNNGTEQTRVSLIQSSDGTARVDMLNAGAFVAGTGSTGVAPAALGRFAFAAAFQAGSLRASLNGSAVSGVSGAGWSVPVGLTTLRIGNGAAGSSEPWNGHVERVIYWPTALSDAQLQALSLAA